MKPYGNQKVYIVTYETISMLEVKIPETNDAYNKILYWFFSFPYKKTTLSNLSSYLKISKTTANKEISRLTKDGFITREIIGKSWQLSCNTKHEYNFSKKIAHNLEMVYKSKLIEEIYKEIKNPKTVILFGSYRKGDDTEESDIDIAVEVIGNEKLRIKEILTFNHFGYRKDVKVNLHIFSRNNINNNLFSNISNGIVLDGFLEVKK